MILVSLIEEEELLEKAYALRHEVFVEEQKVPAEIERDIDDENALHVAAIDDGDLIATGRIVIHADEGKIGRMAVKKAWRGRGIGRKILEKLMEIGKEKRVKKFYLHAQLRAQPFYLKEGFVPVGEIFKEAGIPHQRMDYGKICID